MIRKAGGWKLVKGAFIARHNPTKNPSWIGVACDPTHRAIGRGPWGIRL